MDTQPTPSRGVLPEPDDTRRTVEFIVGAAVHAPFGPSSAAQSGTSWAKERRRPGRLVWRHTAVQAGRGVMYRNLRGGRHERLQSN